MGFWRKIFKSRNQKRMNKNLPKCSTCGRIIFRQTTSIANDIRRSGGVVVGGTSLDSSMYECTICTTCGSVFCLSCQRPVPDTCPKCGKSKLRPGFADLIQKYYKGELL